MYAIVDISGQQFKVEKDQKVFVHRIEGKEGSKVDFDKVLLIDNDSKVVVGTPVISGAMVSAKIIEHLKGDKVIVFKKKRRKGYRVKNGHRQFFTQVQIESIIETGAKPKAVESKKAVAPEKPAEKTSSVKKETPAASAKPVAAKKPTAKPAAAKAKTETAAKKPAAKPAAKKTTTAATKKPATKKAAPKKAE
jgi:large subunit ribosomal protein L21